jgi:hypothetical protein
MTNNELRIMALTATPKDLYKMYPGKVEDILSDDEKRDLKHYSTHGETYATIDNLIEGLPTGKGIIYTQRIKNMREYAEKIRAKHSTLNVEMIWSMNNEKEQMTDEQCGIWASILEDEVVPNDVDVLLINASCETCINIRGTIDYMIIDSWDLDTIHQVRGRYRDDLKLCYIPSDKPSYIHVPNQFLNIPLFKTEKKELCEAINYRRNGKLMSFPTIKQMLIDTGDYQITAGRSQKGGKDNEYHEINLIK